MTKFSTAKRLSKSERATEFASVAAAFLPNAEELDPVSETRESLFQEVERIYGLSYSADLFSTGHTLGPAITKLHSALYNEIRDSVLPKASIASVRDRLGMKGLLAPSLYNLSFADGFEDTCGAANISKRTVELIVEKSDDVEHLFSSFETPPGAQQFSLFLKKHPSLKDCSILVLALRHFAKLIVQGAWHIFHKVLGSDPSERPVRLLERLANRYGVAFSFLGIEEPVKFLMDRQVPRQSNSAERIYRLPDASRVDAIVSFIPSAMAVKCILAFTISVDAYMRDMAAAGLKGKLNY